MQGQDLICNITLKFHILHRIENSELGRVCKQSPLAPPWLTTSQLHWELFMSLSFTLYYQGVYKMTAVWSKETFRGMSLTTCISVVNNRKRKDRIKSRFYQKSLNCQVWAKATYTIVALLRNSFLLGCKINIKTKHT